MFEFPYDRVYNNRLKLVGAPSKGVLRNIQRKSSIEHIFNCMTVVHLFKSGLYCELCCSPLKLLAEAEIVEEQCYKCDNKKFVRFVCINEEERCPGTYCFKCSKNQAILRTPTQLLCFLKHEFVFLHRKGTHSKMKVVPSRCDLCLGFTEAYYL